MEIVTKVMEKSWKSHGNVLVKMCTNPVYIYIYIYMHLYIFKKNVYELNILLYNIHVNTFRIYTFCVYLYKHIKRD